LIKNIYLLKKLNNKSHSTANLNIIYHYMSIYTFDKEHLLIKKIK